MMIFTKTGDSISGGRHYTTVAVGDNPFNCRHYYVEEDGDSYRVSPLYGITNYLFRDKIYIRDAMKKGFHETKGSIILERSNAA